MSIKENFAIDYANTPFPNTSRTGADTYRLNWRCEILLSRNLEAIKGKKILDLTSHDGRFTYASLKLGAKHVTGVEGREYLVKSSIDNLTQMGYTQEQFTFIHGDIFDHLPKMKPKEFDTILCLGIFDHTIRQIELVREMQRIQPATLILDMYIERGYFIHVVNPLKLIPAIRFRYLTKISHCVDMATGMAGTPCLVFRYESHEKEGATIDPIDITARPTYSFVESIFRIQGFDIKKLKWNKKEISNWGNVKDYIRNTRACFIARPVEQCKSIPTTDK